LLGSLPVAILYSFSSSTTSSGMTGAVKNKKHEPSRPQGRMAVVTGGAQGIGAAIVERMEASGANVRVWDIAAKKDPVDVSIKRGRDGDREVARGPGQDRRPVNNARHRRPQLTDRRYPSTNGSACCASISPASSCRRAVAPHMVKPNTGASSNIASIGGKEGNPSAVATARRSRRDRAPKSSEGDGADRGARELRQPAAAKPRSSTR